ncbi:streptophobe family protein [Streptomyces sp. SP18CS02]|uniref:streptophobe family protein n=1 Tax=Streptomyces sp. SP18CS02 TaxID=3002531 RepID=UPI002E7A062A|nr:streptophobe family protein [Streptomyces sp. SP18CS02]MEE1757422.1 streptophobe family protein [Streptomyces sp. SP18CS02]
MSRQGSTARSGALRVVHDWRDALVAVAAGLVAMAVTAALGLWAAGAAQLPDGAFPRVVAAVVVMAAGGTVELFGNAGALADTDAELAAMPLSVTLAGALAIGICFLRPLRHRAVAGTGELLGRVARTTVLWLAALAAVTALARQHFPIVTDTPADLIGELLDATPTVGFGADLGPTLLFGLLWVLGVLLAALLVSRRAPLPSRLLHWQQPVRPAAFAMLLLLLAYVVIGLVAGLVVAATRGHPDRTFAVLLLGLPNIAWLALGVGIGGSWEGKVEEPFGLPLPQVLDSVLRGQRNSTVDVRSLAAYDERAWWLVPIAAGLVLAAAFVMAVRSPAGVRLWRHAMHGGIAFALTMLAICPVTRVHARYGLSLLGIGDIEEFGGEVVLKPHLWTIVALALLWGLVAGLLGGLLASRVRRRGEVDADGREPGGTGMRTAEVPGAGRPGNGVTPRRRPGPRSTGRTG